MKEKEKKPEEKFELRDHIHVGGFLQKYLGVEIYACTYSAAGGTREAAVAITDGRAVLCHDVSAAINYIRTWNQWRTRHAST